MTRTLPLSLTGLVVAALVSGCGGGAAAPVAAATLPGAPPAPVATASSPPACTAAATTQHWPSQVPQDIPVPPTTKIATTTRTKEGLTLVRFSTIRSLRDGVVFLASSLPPAGFTLGRGDAETVEADVPFSRGQLRGLMKMVADTPCSTQWILALQTAQAAAVPPGAPLLQRRTTASPTPLPF